MTIVIGINELDSQFSGTTLFNTVVVIGPDGTLLNRHRKLMPTNPERMVWGMGDASGLKVVDTPAGRLGALICWESYMPLARYALYAQDIEIYVAPTWDTGESWLATMRHIAKEAGCWVIGTATALQGSDMPADFPERDRLFKPDEWINDGDAVVIKPMGAIAAGPLTARKAFCTPKSTAKRRGGRDVRSMSAATIRGRHLLVLGGPQAASAGAVLGLTRTVSGIRPRHRDHAKLAETTRILRSSHAAIRPRRRRPRQFVQLEHVNVQMPDQRLAQLFYAAGLGLTRDPYLMVVRHNMWINVGRSQFHLPTGQPQVLRGHTGLVMPAARRCSSG